MFPIKSKQQEIGRLMRRNIMVSSIASKLTKGFGKHKKIEIQISTNQILTKLLTVFLIHNLLLYFSALYGSCLCDNSSGMF